MPGPIQVELVANRILAIILNIEVLDERIVNPLIISVVTLNTQISFIIQPHAIIILTRELKIKAYRISVGWKGLEEANTTAKLSKERCMQFRNNYLMVGSVMPKTSKLLFMWRI
jgi:hypothetical protein